MSVRCDILVISGVSAGDVFRFVLTEASPIKVGRDPTASLVLQDPMVSRNHAELILEGGKVFVRDSGSTHGTVHMGFRLEAGDSGKRPISDGDEFKIGGTIFRVSLPQDTVAAKASLLGKFLKDRQNLSGSWVESISNLKTQPRKLIAAGLILILGLLLILGGESSPSLPPQKSKTVYQLPEYRVMGYWPGGKGVKPEEKNTAHLDKVVFNLPTSDLVVEFEYQSEENVQILLDESLVETLEPWQGTWRHRQIIIRDALLGRERRLVFDNRGFPQKTNEKQSLKRWAVRNVRASPVARDLQRKLDIALQEAVALASTIDTSPGALFTVIRALQKCIIEALDEIRVEAVGLPVLLDGDSKSVLLEVRGLTERIQALIEQRQLDSSLIATQTYLEELKSMVQALDGELWRRVNSRLGVARSKARAKNYIEAYDNLLAAKNMFPEEADYRWILANTLINNQKVVPKSVRKNPQKFRK